MEDFEEDPGPSKRKNGTWEEHIEEFFKHTENIIAVISKRKIAFYGHITRKDIRRLIRPIFTYLQENKFKSGCITNTEKDIEEFRITEEDS